VVAPVFTRQATKTPLSNFGNSKFSAFVRWLCSSSRASNQDSPNVGASVG
jgi:hypothetical protein